MGPGCCCGCSGSGTAPDRSYAGTRMGEALDKLYRVKYAKSGRASCKKCSESLAKDPLQMAVIVQVRARSAASTLQGAVLLGAFARSPTLGRLIREVLSSVDGATGSRMIFNLFWGVS